ncbi:MAG: heme o synthase [Spirochaetia bacterium]|nr:heme o synthase [Spirochaetia bacterium]
MYLYNKVTSYFSLIKPKIVIMCLLMNISGIVLAVTKYSIEFSQAFIAIIAFIFNVAAANALNMYFERNSDKLMKRTAKRPLPAGKINPVLALVFGSTLGILSLVLLYAYVNKITFILGTVALFLYVFVYTPLKYKTSSALIIGAIPGAMPPLMGYTSVMNEINSTGLVLFAILFLWQMPHFLAISITRKKEYAKAGIKALSIKIEEKYVYMHMIFYSIILIPAALLLVPVENLGWVYMLLSILLGLWFLFSILKGYKSPKKVKLSRQIYLKSMVYLPVLVLTIFLDLILK